MKATFAGMTQKDFDAMREMVMAQAIQFAHEDALAINAEFDKSLKGKIFAVKQAIKKLFK